MPGPPAHAARLVSVSNEASSSGGCARVDDVAASDEAKPAAQGAARTQYPRPPASPRCPTGATRSRDDVSREADALLRVDIDSLTEDDEDNMISESLRIIHELYAAIAAEAPSTSVSYTHLTLPTICSV